MFKLRKLYMLAAVTMLGVGCARFSQNDSGDVIDPADAAKTVVLHVDNHNDEPMELRTVLNGISNFIGSVAPSDSTSILLDPSMFPTGFLYLVAIPSDLTGRYVSQPLSAAKGDRIRLTIDPSLRMSKAIVLH